MELSLRLVRRQRSLWLGEVPLQDIWSTSAVKEFVDEEHGWKLIELRNLLPADAVAEVVATLCPNTLAGNDKVIWGGSPNGEFSTKSAYNLITSFQESRADHVWRRVWKWDGPQRIRCFFWLILNKGLKTRSRDGSVLQSSMSAGCGGVFRSAEGRWVLGFAYNLGRSNILLAELRAIETALRIAWERGCTKVWVESDSLTAINLILKDLNLCHPYANWKQKAWQVVLSHSFREGNRVADCLANSAHNLDLGLHLFHNPPGFCWDLLR
ncbi:Ribonuclease H domain [Sesbania bispinosa]|nr:Ribonuclease H domain [Sesbania bispinosa]